MLDLIPKIYDSERQVRLMGEDVTVGLDGQPELVNDLSQARFDIRVDVGPSYTTQRIESATAMLDYAKSDPAAMPFMRDVFVEQMDWPGARQLAERLKRTIPPQVLGPDEQGEPVAQMPDPQVVMAQQRMQFDQQAQQLKLQMEQQKTAQEMQLEAQTSQQKLQLEATALERKQQIADQRLEMERKKFELEQAALAQKLQLRAVG